MKYSILLFFLLVVNISLAQKINGNKKDLKILEGVSELNLVYDYSNFGVGKFDNEADYVAKKVEDYNDDEAGKGDEWKEQWVADREERYEPNFEDLLNKHLGDKITADKGLNDAPVTLIVKTTFVEPGFNIGVMRKNAYIDLELIFIETGNPDNVLAEYELLKSPGRGAGGYDFDTGYRIEEAYAKAGKEFGNYMKKSKAF